MKEIFFSNLEWKTSLKNFVGFPRPFFILNKEQRKPNSKSTLLLKSNLYLHKKIPVPWQSIPVFNDMQKFELNVENEKLVYKEELCGFCGLKFSDNDNCSRWKVYSPNQTDFIGPRVFSDTHPLHPQCMKQARIFCPFMRQREDSEFEHGTYKELRKNFINTTPNLPPI
jgi:hypothetical protein